MLKRMLATRPFGVNAWRLRVYAGQVLSRSMIEKPTSTMG